MVTAKRRQNPTHVFLNFMKYSYHLELIIYYICLYIGEESVVMVQKSLKIVFVSYMVTPPYIPTLVTRYDLTEKHIVFDLYLNYYLLAIMLQHIKIRIKIGV